MNGMVYLGIVETWLMPKLNEASFDCVFQPDGCPCHYHNDLRINIYHTDGLDEL